MTESILTHKYDNGLVLLAEPMQWLESAAFSLLLPAGCCYDPLNQPGLSNFTAEMVQRGSGSRDSRQFVSDLEKLGVDRSASVSNAHTCFGGAMLADNLYDTLSIYSDLVLRPHLPEDQLEEGRLVCFQEIRSIEDDLAHKVMMELRRRFYPSPWGRSCQGTQESISQISNSDIIDHHRRTFSPRKAMISVAGKIEWPKLKDRVGELFADWQSREQVKIEEKSAERGYIHLDHSSSQTHIGIAYPSVQYAHPDFYQARGAVGVLSDGMSSRLFTEVREKRGLCYTVFASCHSIRDRGGVLCYSGTTNERAQETLEVMIAELNRLSDGIEQAELDRLKTRIKSTLIMQQESSSARSATIATDWYHLGRVMSITELGKIIDALSCESINRYLAENRPSNFTVVTLGQEQLEVPVEVLPS